MKHALRLGALVLLLSAGLAGSAAGSAVDRAGGYLSVGYARLFVSDAPGGSMSVGGGVDYPVAERVRVGVGIGFHLLGSRTVEQDSVTAGLDYSAFEALATAHLALRHAGPLAQVSLGAGILSARAELSSGGSGAAFSKFAVEHVGFALGADAEALSPASSPVRAGLALGMRVAFLPHDTWTLGLLRVVVHY